MPRRILFPVSACSRAEDAFALSSTTGRKMAGRAAFSAAGPRGNELLQQVGIPALFVVLWSTGFIGARLGLPHAEPLTFLTLRYALVVGLLLLQIGRAHV